ncbi:MAG: tetratricopeptide repeat protein [Azospirillum sp.]|nr:tetratricopeptide repeat protein [Azospirillum sp.]
MKTAKLLKSAVDHHLNGRLIDAEAGYRKIVRIDKRHFDALHLLGVVCFQRGRLDEALALIARALTLQPDSPEALNNFGLALNAQGSFDDAAANFRRALALRPDYGDALNNLGLALAALGRFEDAIAAYDRAIELKPDSTDSLLNKGQALLTCGRYRDGWRLLENRFALGNGNYTRPFTGRQWKGTEFHGKTLLIWCEQGFGDSLQFIRYAELCKRRGGAVTVLCPRPLARILGSNRAVDAVAVSTENLAFDAQVAAMSLPYVLASPAEPARIDSAKLVSDPVLPAEVPYLHVDPAARAFWRPRIGEARSPRVGLVWNGCTHENNPAAILGSSRKSLHLSQLSRLLDNPRPSFFSLQLGAAAGQIAELALTERLVDVMEGVSDFMDTAALIETLDLVISVDTAVAHLAGALGKPVWLLLRFDACWRWLRDRNDSPWYPTARLFRQPSPGDWSSVVAEVDRALEAFHPGP